jgi:transcriptional regulator with PAS, ATPase and Fis domain
LGVNPSPLNDAELACLTAYEWPGNVRELKNVIERSLLLNTPPSEAIGGTAQDVLDNEVQVNSTLLADIEKHHILKILDIEKGNKSAAALKLGVSRKTLDRKVTAWGKSV